MAPNLPTENIHSHNLKQLLASKIDEHNKKVSTFRKLHGGTVVQNLTVDMIYGGMRSLKALLTETSEIDPEKGIQFRGYAFEECLKLLPKATNGEQPLPEGVFFLLLTGEIPNEAQVEEISREWARRSEVPEHVEKTLKTFPKTLHPMAQMSAAIASLAGDSKFAKAFANKVPKSSYWEYVYEDAMDLLAKLPKIAAMIYRNLYKDGVVHGEIDSSKDWSSNYASFLGNNSPQFIELIRLYNTIYCDHEGGNVIAHTCQLVASSLSNPYLAYSAAMGALAGPLAGGAHAEVLFFLNKLTSEHGYDIDEENLRFLLWEHLISSQVIPGYGHAVLRTTDPRDTAFRSFGLKHLPNNPYMKLCSALYNTVPDILIEQGKVKNPYTNVEAHSGVLLQHFGIQEVDFYPVMIGVARAIGCMSQMIWDRGMGLPIERPKSISTESLMKLVNEKKTVVFD